MTNAICRYKTRDLSSARKRESEKIIRYLIGRHGRFSSFDNDRYSAALDVSELNVCEIQYGDTMLHYIIRKKVHLDIDGEKFKSRREFIKYLITSSKFDIEYLNDEGLTPLQLARKLKDREAVQALLQSGANDLPLSESGWCTQQ